MALGAMDCTETTKGSFVCALVMQGRAKIRLRTFRPPTYAHTWHVLGKRMAHCIQTCIPLGLEHTAACKAYNAKLSTVHNGS